MTARPECPTAPCCPPSRRSIRLDSAAAWWPARRATPVNIFVRAAIAAVLVVGVGLVAINVLPRQPDGSSVGGPPSASPSPSASASPSPAPSAAAIPELTQTYVSSLNGFSIGYPDGFEIEPATVVSKPNVDQGNKEFDFIHSGTYSFRASSTVAPDGVVTDESIDRVVGYQPGGCAVRRSEQLEIIIDWATGARSGRVVPARSRRRSSSVSACISSPCSATVSPGLSSTPTHPRSICARRKRRAQRRRDRIGSCKRSRPAGRLPPRPIPSAESDFSPR